MDRATIRALLNEHRDVLLTRFGARHLAMHFKQRVHGVESG